MVAIPANLQASANLSIPGVGTAGGMLQGLLDNSPNATALASQLNTYASDPTLTSMSSTAAEGIALATQGKAPTTAQVESMATGVATAAAVVAGVSASVAGVVLAPIAACVFGGGALIGEGIKKIFHITNCGITTGKYCDGKAPKNPGDPGFATYGQIITGNINPSTAKAAPWQAYSHGAFETAMRPVIMRIIEIYGNCGALPGVKDERVALQGLVNFWNAHAPPDTPMRAITWLTDDVIKKYPDGMGIPASVQASSKLFGGDPVQQMMFLLFDTFEVTDCHAKYTGQPWPWHLMVADIPVAVPPPPAVVAKHVISLKLNIPSVPPKVIALSLPPKAVVVVQPSQVGGPLITVDHPSFVHRALPFIPAVLGAACFPVVGVVAPMVGCVTSAVWMALRKK